MAEGNGQSGGSVMAPDFKPTPPSQAFVSIRVDQVLVVEDLLDETPDWVVGCGLPRRRPVASLIGMSNASIRVRVQETREEFLRKIDPNGKLFATFKWRDPEGRVG